MMRALAAIGAAIAVLVVVAVLLRNGALDSPTPSPRTEPPAATGATIRPTVVPTRTPVATPSASPTPIDTSVVATGVVVPIRSAQLATRVSGVVDAIYVEEGSNVAPNQLLLELDQSTYEAAIAVAQADVRRATVAVEQAQLQLDGLPPDASPSQVEALQSALRVAEADLELAQATLNEAEAALLQTEIRAPFAGTVADIALQVGEQALAGQTVITIGDLREWLIETTDLSELEVVRVAVGDRATVTFDALPELVVAGTVDTIQVRGTTAEEGVVFAVTIRPDEHHPELRWSMSATVRITPGA